MAGRGGDVPHRITPGVDEGLKPCAIQDAHLE